jgi:hypothetical protein
VGILQLSVAESGTVYSTRLVSQPARLSFVDIKSGQLTLPDVAQPPGFVPAGETFTVRVLAENAAPGNSSIPSPPNFGNESPPAAVAMGQDTAPAVQGTLGSPVGGIATGQLTYSEVGYVKLTPLMATAGLDYMGSGTPVPGVARVVGRFYPAYFTTTVTSRFVCQPSMVCPSGKLSTGEDVGVSGAVYSGQSFTVEVTPYNKAGDPVTQYVGTVALSTVDKPGPNGNPVASTVGALTGASIPVPPAPPPGSSTFYSATPVFTLPKPFDPAAPHALGWSTPATIYFRAQAQETVLTSGGGTTTATITSRDAATTTGEEDGVRVVTGRMQVSNAFGSELLKLRVPVAVQYWSGSAWDNNIGDDTSEIGTVPYTIPFTSCTGKLSTGAGASNCNTNLLKTLSVPATVTGGVGDVFLAAPGGGNTGSGMMSVSKSGQPWLPVTPGKVVFGINKSPVIYIREVY